MACGTCQVIFLGLSGMLRLRTYNSKMKLESVRGGSRKNLKVGVRKGQRLRTLSSCGRRLASRDGSEVFG